MLEWETGDRSGSSLPILSAVMEEIDKLYPGVVFKIAYEDWADRYNVFWKSRWLASYKMYYDGVLIFRDEYAYFSLGEVPEGHVFYSDPAFLKTVLAWVAKSFNV